MNRKKVTSTDVARKAGVSQSTVSMILNKKYNVSFSRETVERVECAAKELGYENEKKHSKTRILQEQMFVNVFFEHIFGFKANRHSEYLFAL